MSSRRVHGWFLLAVSIGCATVLSAKDRGRGEPGPFQAHVDMKTFMEHVISPSAAIIWRVNGIFFDDKGEHDLGPRSDADWEQIVSGAATLAEATNALMIPQRVRDPQWGIYVRPLSIAADLAYRAAESRDLVAISKVSDELDGICSACHRHYGVE
ncbi:MAG: hypothetical protein M3O26_06960 [Pseudomonadota bacterium]|nr:hypothetical protein [Pseudomonadota bacterium]